MSDTAVAAPEPLAPIAAHEDRMLPAVVYGLYLVGLTHGLTILIGLVVAYVNRSTAGPVMQSHYTFQINTFWRSIWWFLIGLAMVIVGIPLSAVLVGIPVVILGGCIMGAVWLWFLVRSIMGAVYLAQGEAHPRPDSWLL